MPIFEYECNGCHHAFEVLLFGSEKATCPACGGTDLAKQLSGFAVGGTAPGARPGCPAPAPGGG
jgi:putative FmdB family regulatory protein